MAPLRGAASDGRLSRLLASCVLTALAACSAPAPIEPRPWELDVPEGLPEIVYSPVSVEDRQGHRIELIEDLVIGSEDNANERFGDRVSVGVDDQGRIYVADTDNHRIQVFDADGTYLATLGRDGQGPGEFEFPRTIAVAGDRVFVGDRRKVSVWSTVDFSFIEELTVVGNLARVQGAQPDGTVLALVLAFDPVEDGTPNDLRVSVRMGPLLEDGTLSPVFVETDLSNESDAILPGGAYLEFAISPHPRPYISTGSAGETYYTKSSEYQIMALRGDGSPRWALQVATTPSPFDSGSRGAWLKWMQERMPEVIDSHLNAPEELPAVGRLRVDGRGRLHVYGYIPEWEDPDVDRPVDVYSGEGQRLFAGYAPAADWVAARGDYVYGAGLDAVTQEYRLYRWRLEMPTH